MTGKGQPRKTNTPFSRIKVDEIKFVDERLKDNTFGSRKAASNDYGARASADLIVTRGASFRKEKNKKKRGSYRGGDITVCQAVSGGYFVIDACHSRWKVIVSSFLIEGELLVGNSVACMIVRWNADISSGRSDLVHAAAAYESVQSYSPFRIFTVLFEAG